MLSNAYFLAKFRFDTAENEPAKKLQNLNFPKIANFALSPPIPSPRAGLLGALDDPDMPPELDRANLTGLVLGCIEPKFCK